MPGISLKQLDAVRDVLRIVVPIFFAVAAAFAVWTQQPFTAVILVGLALLLLNRK